MGGQGPTSRDARAVELYEAFRERLPQALELELAPYPRPFVGSFDFRCILFHQEAQDCLREIANAINDFNRYLTHLDAWRPLYAELPEADRYSVLLEHVRPLATLCLNAPYSIRGRLIYAACAVGQHARAFASWPGVRPDWRSGHADMKVAKRLNDPWNAWPALAGALGAMDQEEFEAETSGFRNEHHHGHPRSIEVGFVSAIRRLPGDRESWSMGEQGPLTVAKLVPWLAREHALAMAAFRAFLGLVEEQGAAGRREEGAEEV